MSKPDTSMQMGVEGVLFNPIALAIETGAELERKEQRAAEKVEFLDNPHDPTVYGRRIGTAPVEWLSKRSTRSHEVFDLGSFATAVGRWAEEAPEGDPEATVWVGRNQVVLCCDDDSRLDHVLLNFNRTEGRTALERLGGPVTHKDLIWKLRTELRDVIKASALLDRVRLLKWQHGAEGESDVDHGAESMRSSTIARVEGLDAIPEEVVAECRWWAELDHVATIDVAVAVDAAERKFVLRPVGDSWRRAEAAALAVLRDLVVDALTGEGVEGTVTVLCGEV